MRARRAVAAAAAVGALFLAGCSSSDDGAGSEEHPGSGPEYEAAMERCALSRLRNGGVEDASTESWAYSDAYAECTYGRSFDDISSPARGWGPADPGYWDE
ncbi:hypothetical protein [Streptomyces sp. CL12-4]|uniref:hypothetical protein n=1 Tax=Streptomyces sp. CL12-4 TaxID=2810306 RepID=UPI001EFA9807|nr:hypothetical protein [Streptomyces sp. CL12-4]MCG8971745.1 hypothetical protein [Streptomyces sp. CL12-4]